MFQFVECEFFTNYNSNDLEVTESLSEPSLVKECSNNSHSTLFQQESSDPSSSHPSHNSSDYTSRRNFAGNSSDKHNMVKQLIITIRQMMGKYIEDIGCSHVSRQIITATWKIFETTKSYNKQILKAMFDKEPNQKIIQKTGLGQIFREFGAYAFQNAMEELRLHIMLRMRSENLKSHMFNRTLSKKDILAAYVQYFIEEELRIGKISSRFNEAANKRMKQILKNNKNQDQQIDCYFESSNEVLDRFTSTQATY